MRPNDESNREQASSTGVARSETEQTAFLTELIKDWNWAEEALAAGKLDRYVRLFVAILNGEVVDSDADATELRERVARSRGVDPERPVILYVNPIDIEPLDIDLEPDPAESKP